MRKKGKKLEKNVVGAWSNAEIRVKSRIASKRWDWGGKVVEESGLGDEFTSAPSLTAIGPVSPIP